MSEPRLSIHEDEVQQEDYADRWSKDLVGSDEIATTAGFNMGVAEYHVKEFGPLQVHDDQEVLYVVKGEGQVRVGESVHCAKPGTAVYVPPNTEHATRRTGDESVKVVYAHGAV